MGTQDIFYEDGPVLFFSTHQSPWYPETGAASERGEGAGRGKDDQLSPAWQTRTVPGSLAHFATGFCRRCGTSGQTLFCFPPVSIRASTIRSESFG